MFKFLYKPLILIILCALLTACIPAAEVSSTATLTPVELVTTKIPPTVTPTVTPTTIADTPTPEPEITTDTWFKTYGGNENDVSADVLVADDGGLYIIGTTNMRFEPEMDGDIYLIRTDATGDILWEQIYEKEGYQRGQSITWASDGGLLISGGASSSSGEGMDTYLMKLDQDGNELWSKTISGFSVETAAAQLMADGSYILAGNILDHNDYVTYPGTAGYGGFEYRSNIFLARLDSEGNEIWSHSYGGENNMLLTDSIQTSDGGMVLLATILNYPEPDNDIYLLKINQDGQEEWSHLWEEENASGYALIQTSDGGYLVTGPYTPAGSEKKDFLFIKADSMGNEIWRSTFGDPEMIDYGAVLAETSDGGYIAAGELVEDLYTWEGDIALAKIDGDGNLLWEQAIETNSHCMFGNILQYPDGGFMIVGSIFSGNDFDIFVIKTDPQGYSTAESEPAAFLPANDLSPSLITIETAKQLELLATFSGHSDRVISLAISKDGAFLASASLDNKINLWDVASRQLVHTFNIHEACLNNITFSPDGRILASSEAIWDVETMQVLHQFEQRYCAAVAFSPHGGILAVANLEGPIALWDVTSFEVIRTFGSDSGNIPFSIEFSSDGEILAEGLKGGVVRLWDVASGQILYTLDHGNDYDDIHDIAFSSDSGLLASGGTTKMARLWDVANGQVLQTFNIEGVMGLAFSPDDTILATAGSILALWETSSGRLICILPHSDELMSVVFSPDGTLLVSGGYDNNIYLWGLP